MLGPTLDVAIGLVSTFVIFAGLLSIIVESVATFLKLRSKALENGLISIIEDPMTRAGGPPTGVLPRTIGLFSAHKQTLAAVRAADSSLGVSFFDAVYNHPMVGGTSLKNRPSYVPSSNFASAVIYVLSEAASHGALGSRIEQGIAALPKELSTLKTALVTIAQQTPGDVVRFKAGVEAWYDSAMDRLSGDYKRFSQACTFTLGLIAAIVCNVDTIKIVQHLYAEPGLRTVLSNDAAEYLKTPPNLKSSEAGATLEARLSAVGRARDLLLASAPPMGWGRGNAPEGVQEFLSAAAGWILTALAGMMGASFWFGLLQKLIDLRGAGPKPKSSANQTPAKDD